VCVVISTWFRRYYTRQRWQSQTKYEGYENLTEKVPSWLTRT
jgi:hypothetical protein